MKSLKLFAGAVFAVLFAAVMTLAPAPEANAQDFTGNGIWQSKKATTSTTPKLNTIYATGITSGTSVANDLPPVSVDASKKVDVATTATANVSLTINLYNGTDLVAAIPVAAGTTPAVQSFTAPVYFDGVTVSPTAGFTGVVNAKAFVMQPK